MSATDSYNHLRASFNDYYNQKLWPKLFELETQRLKYLHRFWLLVIVMCILFPAFIVKMWGDLIYAIFVYGSSKDVEAAIKIGILAASVILAIVGSPIVSYKKNVKSSIIEDFINFFGTFRHSSALRIKEDIIRQSHLIGTYNYRSGDDYFDGLYKNTSMIISEENFTRKQGKNTFTVFKGIMIVINLPRPVNGQTIVFADKGLLNFTLQAPKDLQNIKLEDVVFEKEFEVFGSNQIEARYLLTTALMERMLKIKNAFNGRKIQFSFFNDKLLAAIETKEDMFEPSSLFKTTTNRKPIDNVLEQFISVFAVADFLKLTQQ